MPDEIFNPADVFHIIGYTAAQITEGLQLHLMNLSTRVLKSNEALWKQLGPLVPAMQAGKVKRHIVEIYSVTPFLFESAVPAAIAELQGLSGPYLTFEFFNDVAHNLCREYKIQLPAIIGKTTRAELPPLPQLGITIRGVCYKRA
jgi:hypothetical protein